MKAITKIFTLAMILFGTCTNAQITTPDWVANFNTLPDSISKLIPVKVLSDNNGNTYVLSNYFNNATGLIVYQINLKKINASGNIVWTYNHIASNPNAYDMAVDNNGNCYIAGGLNSPTTQQILLLGVSSNGNLLWQKNSTNSFSSGSFKNIIIRNNMLFLNASSGLAKFDLLGNEQWSNSYFAICFNVDYLGRLIFSGFINNTTSLCRLKQNGSIDFNDTTLQANRIGIDNNNRILLLSSNYPNYMFSKLDSTGSLLWSYSQFPIAPPFGDIGMEVVSDLNNDIYLVGIQDTIFKLASNGALAWKKPMNTLDNYTISVKMDNSNLFVAGTESGFGSGNPKVALFNINGNETWSAYYNGVVNGQEYLVNFDTDFNGIYLLENINQNGRLIKFPNPSSGSQVNFSEICVDSVWYDSSNQNLINVSIFNGSANFINYPSIQIVTPNGDTIANKHALVNFFGQLSNTYQTYVDTITVQGITDFSNYTFVLNLQFNDTSVVIDFCNSTTKIVEKTTNELKIFPNPTSKFINISGIDKYEFQQISISNMLGETVFTENPNNINQLNLENLSKGIYMLTVSNNSKKINFKIIKE